MKRLVYLSFALIAVFSFSACHKNSTSPTVQSMVVGKWNLQKQTYVEYANDIKLVDTVCVTADTLTAYLQFNADKSFTSEGRFFSVNPGNIFDNQADVSGTYISSNSTLTVSKTMVGLLFFPASYSTANFLPATDISNPFHTSKLNSITSTTLSIHTEDGYTATVNAVSTNIKTVNDFYYTK